MATDLVDQLDAPPLAKRIAGYIHDAIHDYTERIDVPTDALVLRAAMRVLHDRDVASLVDRMAVLDAQHQPVRWADDSDTVVCSCGSGAFSACRTRAVIDGRPL